jgi:hypothetical protein
VFLERVGFSFFSNLLLYLFGLFCWDLFIFKGSWGNEGVKMGYGWGCISMKWSGLINRVQVMSSIVNSE